MEADQLQFLTHYQHIVRLQAENREMLSLLADATYAYPQCDIYDVRESLLRVRIEGLFLDETELFDLQRTLLAIHQLTAFLSELPVDRFPHLKSLPQQTTFSPDDALKHIDRILDKYGQIKDNASPELQRIRQDLRRAEGSVSRAIQSILHQAQEAGYLDRNAAPTMREGRLVLPVPPMYKRKIGGIVHDESATGKTLFIEPQQVVEANNHIRELESEERREKTRILIECTNYLRPLFEPIREAHRFLGYVDFLHAKAICAKDLGAIAPEVENRPFIDWYEARHPVLLLNFRKAGKQVVPLTIHLNERNRILVISGPNAGGKSVCLKTVGLLQMMMQMGLMVPLSEQSKMGIFSQILLDIGDQQSLEDDLSTYSSHLRNMKSFVQHADAHTLLLIDEFGGGTEPSLGGAIAESILVRLNQAKVFGVITTHYTNLKHLAETTEGISNGAMLYDRGQLRPLFALSQGQAGSSFAIEIARQIGLPEGIIAHATELVGKQHIDYDKNLQDIARDKRYWASKRQQVRMLEKELEAKVAKYDDEMAEVKNKKKAILLEAKQQAADLLAESNAVIEAAIRDIQKSKADKLRTQKARDRVEHQKQKVAVPKEAQAPTAHAPKKVLHDLSDLKQLTKNPTLLIKEDQPHRRTNIADELRRHKLSFHNELDLRGMRADEALQTLISYLDEAVMVGTQEVRILHGTGTGALKKLVSDYLRDESHSQYGRLQNITYSEGDINHGGAGFTIVRFS